MRRPNYRPRPAQPRGQHANIDRAGDDGMLDMNSFDSLAVTVAAHAMVVVFFAARALRHIGRRQS